MSINFYSPQRIVDVEFIAAFHFYQFLNGCETRGLQENWTNEYYTESSPILLTIVFFALYLSPECMEHVSKFENRVYQNNNETSYALNLAIIRKRFFQFNKKSREK